MLPAQLPGARRVESIGGSPPLATGGEWVMSLTRFNVSGAGSLPPLVANVPGVTCALRARVGARALIESVRRSARAELCATRMTVQCSPRPTRLLPAAARTMGYS